MIEHIITQFLLFLPLCLGIYISFSVLRLTDLTTDGSFMLGAGTFAVCITNGFGFYPSLFLAIGAGAIVGAFVAYIQKNKAIDSLIAGVLALFMLQGVNLIVMGKPNISLLGVETNRVIMMTFIPILLLGVIFLFSSPFGLILRGFGENSALLERFGYNPHIIRTLGLMLSNALAAFSGVLTALVFGYADLSMGLGVTLTGIGALMVGLYLVKDRKVKRSGLIANDLVGVMIGIFIYFFILNGFLLLGVDPVYLKIAMGLVLISFLRIRFTKSRG